MFLKILNIFLVIILIIFLELPFSTASDKLSYYMSNIGMDKIDGKVIDFTLSDISGNKVSLKDFKGKVVFLNFWATWCYPCREEMPSMERLYKEFKNSDFIILGVSVDKDGAKKMNNFIKEYGITFPILIDKDGSVAGKYGVRGIPSTFIVNRNGEFIGRVIGAKDWFDNDSLKLIRHILKGS